MILAYVREQGAPRMTGIMTALDLTPGTASGHLSWLVRHGWLKRPARGVYIIPGTDPELPPRPDMSSAIAKRNRVVWANLPQRERDRRIAALARGRRDAALHRARDAGKPAREL